MKRKTPVVDRIIRSLYKAVKVAEKDDWTSKGKFPHFIVEQDRYVQGMRDAISIVLRYRK